MKYLIDQSGLVAEGDYLSLSRTMKITNSLLVDTITGAQHKLNTKARKSIQLLEFSTPYSLWRQYNRSLAVSQREAMDIISFLNHIGGLDIKRSRKGRFLFLVAKLKQLSVGIAPIAASKRWQTDIVTIGRAVLTAMLPLIFAALAIIPLTYGVNMNISLVTIATLGFLSNIWLSTVLHEWAHSKIIAKKTTKQILLQKGLRVGILHKSLPNSTEQFSALAGPVVGACTSILLGVLLGFASGHQKVLFGIGLLVAAMQLISLIPAYGDGRIIWDNLRRK